MVDQSRTLTAPIVLRSLRIWSGLYLLVFVASHLINLSFGLISIEAMDAARPYVTGIWTGPITGTILKAALITHFALGLWALYGRPTLRTGAQDLVQLFTGLLVVPLLATHTIGISMAANSGLHFGYMDTIRLFWLQVPGLGLLQVTLIAVIWVHGCAGLFTWLRSKENAGRILRWLYVAAVAVPILSLLGYAEAGREMLLAEASGDAMADTRPMPTDVNVPFGLIKQVTNWVIYGSTALAILTLVARQIRVTFQPSQRVILVRGDSGEMVSNSTLTLLDGFRQNDQPHANLCHGRGRCGTCAVQVVRAEFPLPKPSELEHRTLTRVNAPPGARLACQVKAAGGKVIVEPIYPADYTFEDSRPTRDAPAEEASA